MRNTVLNRLFFGIWPTLTRLWGRLNQFWNVFVWCAICGQNSHHAFRLVNGPLCPVLGVALLGVFLAVLEALDALLQGRDLGVEQEQEVGLGKPLGLPELFAQLQVASGSFKE